MYSNITKISSLSPVRLFCLCIECENFCLVKGLDGQNIEVPKRPYDVKSLITPFFAVILAIVVNSEFFKLIKNLVIAELWHLRKAGIANFDKNMIQGFESCILRKPPHNTYKGNAVGCKFASSHLGRHNVFHLWKDRAWYNSGCWFVFLPRRRLSRGTTRSSRSIRHQLDLHRKTKKEWITSMSLDAWECRTNLGFGKLPT